MRKLPTTLLSASRELKSVLTRSTFGIALSKLIADNDRMSVLSERQVNTLLNYLSETGTVTFFMREDTLNLISNEYVSKGNVPDLVAVSHKTLKPLVVVEAVVTTNDTKIRKAPSYHTNREKLVVIDSSDYEYILSQFDPQYVDAAVEVMTAIRSRRVGCTSSELTRHSDLFNMLTEVERYNLIQAILRYNDEITYVDGELVPTRSAGTQVLLHQAQATIRALGITGSKDIEVESPIRSQLGKLAGLLSYVKPKAQPLHTSQASAPVTRIVIEEPVKVDNTRIKELMAMISEAESTIRSASVNLNAAVAELKELLNDE